MEGIRQLAQLDPAGAGAVAGQQHLQAVPRDALGTPFPWSSTRCLAGFIAQKGACAGRTRGPSVVDVALMSFTASVDVYGSKVWLLYPGGDLPLRAAGGFHPTRTALSPALEKRSGVSRGAGLEANHLRRQAQLFRAFHLSGRRCGDSRDARLSQVCDILCTICYARLFIHGCTALIASAECPLPRTQCG